MDNLKDDDGASIVLVALLLVVLCGLVGLAVDAAALFQERRELHNGADAAALAVAEDCGLEARPCDDGTALATSEAYAADNASDGAAGIEMIDLDLGAQTIRVDTHTIEADTGGHELEPSFMQLLGIGGTKVEADATAQWGVPKTLQGVLPLIVSHCEWPGHADFTVTIYVHGGAQEDEVQVCNAHPGFDQDENGRLPGGFGWLESGRDCQMDIEVGEWYPNKPGAAVPQGCKDLIQVGATVFIPWYLDTDIPVNGEGGLDGNGRGSYYISGFGAFEIISYRMPGWSDRGAEPELPCSRSAFCIKGTFITESTDLGDFGDGIDYGVVLVKLID